MVHTEPDTAELLLSFGPGLESDHYLNYLSLYTPIAPTCLMADVQHDISNLRKRRGVTKAAVNRLATQVDKLKSKADALDVSKNAQQLMTKLEASSGEFKQIHLSLIDILDDEAKLVEEQSVLDEFLDITDELTSELQALIDSSNVLKLEDQHKVLAQRLARLRRSLVPIDEAITELESAEKPEASHIKVYDEQCQKHKDELTDIEIKLFSLEISETDELMTQHSCLSKTLFTLSIR